jgi:hypothetical protein
MLVEKSFDTGEVVLNYAEGPDNGPPLIVRARERYLPIINFVINRARVAVS